MLLRKILHIKPRPDQPSFLSCKCDEHHRMSPVSYILGLEKAGEEARPAPVVRHPVSRIHVIKVRANQDHGISIARQNANQVPLFQPFHRLLGKPFILTSR